MNALRMLAIVAGLQAQLDVLREELERAGGIERRLPSRDQRNAQPAMFGRPNPDDARERDAGFQRLHDAAAAGDAAENRHTDKE
jgi:hypothetical protein